MEHVSSPCILYKLVFQHSQIVNECKFLFMEKVQLINAEEMTEIECFPPLLTKTFSASSLSTKKALNERLIDWED